MKNGKIIFICRSIIQEPNITDSNTTINQREEVKLLPTTQIIAPNIEIIPSQMTKSQAIMVSEATCSSSIASDTINLSTNTNNSTSINDKNSMAESSINSLAIDQMSSRPQSQIYQGNSNVSHTMTMTLTPTTTTSNTTTTTTATNNSRTAKRTANDYRFGRTIGEGSFSTVYIAQDIHTKKEVASKL